MKIISYCAKPKQVNQTQKISEICQAWKEEGIRLDFQIYDVWWLHLQPEYEKHPQLFDTPMRTGFWLWKPLMILNALKSSDEVLYIDPNMILVDYQGIRRIMDKVSDIAVVDDIGGVIFAKKAGAPFLQEWLNGCLDGEEMHVFMELIIKSDIPKSKLNGAIIEES